MEAEYIDRAEVINILWLFADESCCSIVSDIENLPDADVAPVVPGLWVEWYPPKHMILTGEEMLYRCSSCDAKYSDVKALGSAHTVVRGWICKQWKGEQKMANKKRLVKLCAEDVYG